MASARTSNVSNSDGRQRASLRRALLAWYRRARRDLPWRHTRDPYAIWLSEVMLQQTTVVTARPYYERFLARYPTVQRLATAPIEDVLALWAGLGYYHRARRMQAAAQAIVSQHEGEFPRALEEALALPGVGPYSARAVLSIAYGLAEPVVDGNVRRAIARLKLLRGPDWRSDAAFYAPARELLDQRSPGDWNQALMELGATLCRPHDPACGACPLGRFCQARAAGVAESLPERKARPTPVEVVVAAALVTRGDRVLLVRRRRTERVLAGFWELPQTRLEDRGLVDLVARIRRDHGLELELGAAASEARHAITFRRIRARAYLARLRYSLQGAPDARRWVGPADWGQLPLSALTRKLLAGWNAQRINPVSRRRVQ